MMLASIILAASLLENAQAITNYSAQIDAAIVAKGGTTAGGLTNAPAAIAALPTGGGGGRWEPPEGWPDPTTERRSFFWIEISTNDFSGLKVTFCARNATASARDYNTSGLGAFAIDWGDGSPIVSIDVSTSGQNLSHTYPVGGSYRIEIIPQTDDADKLVQLCNSYGGLFYGGVSSTLISTYKNCFILRGAYIGSQVCDTGILTPVKCGDFVGCENLEEIRFYQGSLQTYGSTSSGVYDYGFSTCKNLKYIELPNSLSKLNASAFGLDYSAYLSCTSLKEITIPENITEINASTFKFCRSLKSIDLSSQTTTIGASAFEGCYDLESITIPQTVTTIGANAFRFTYNLKELIIPEGIATIPSQMAYSSGIKYIDIPSTVTSIEANALNYNAHLETIICRATTPPTLAASTSLSKMYGLTWSIYVPYSADHSILAAYKAATNWATHKNYIYELDENGNIPE